jgi:hypothetical protein
MRPASRDGVPGELTRIKRRADRGLMPIKAGTGGGPQHGASPTGARPMHFTTREPIAPPQLLDLIRALQSRDALAEVRVDVTGRQVRIESRLTATQAAAAIGEAGIAGVVTGTEHVSGGSTCCGGCS